MSSIPGRSSYEQLSASVGSSPHQITGGGSSSEGRGSSSSLRSRVASVARRLSRLGEYFRPITRVTPGRWESEEPTGSGEPPERERLLNSVGASGYGSQDRASSAATGAPEMDRTATRSLPVFSSKSKKVKEEILNFRTDPTARTFCLQLQLGLAFPESQEIGVVRDLLVSYGDYKERSGIMSRRIEDEMDQAVRVFASMDPERQALSQPDMEQVHFILSDVPPS